MPSLSLSDRRISALFPVGNMIRKQIKIKIKINTVCANYLEKRKRKKETFSVMFRHFDVM